MIEYFSYVFVNHGCILWTCMLCYEYLTWHDLSCKRSWFMMMIAFYCDACKFLFDGIFHLIKVWNFEYGWSGLWIVAGKIEVQSCETHQRRELPNMGQTRVVSLNTMYLFPYLVFVWGACLVLAQVCKPRHGDCVPFGFLNRVVRT